MARDKEHIRTYPQFQLMEKWVIEAPDGSMFAHFGKVIKKTALRRKRHPGHDTVSVVRNIYQGANPTSEITIMENGSAWRIEVVSLEVPPKYCGPVVDLNPESETVRPVEPKKAKKKTVTKYKFK